MSVLQIGPYRLLRQVGAGGAAEIYAAEDTRLRRRVAVKLLSRKFTEDNEQIERFRQEADLMSMLSHPNVLTILEVGESDGRHFIVTEYIEGETLRSRLNHGPLTPRDACRVALGIARGLAAAHELWIVHRDLKPENVMLWAGDHVKVLDFGVAKLVGAANRTMPGMVLGTMQYLAPEQVHGEGVDPRTDLWGLGLLLWEMLVGRSPFENLHIPEIFTAIGEARVPSLNEAGGIDAPELDRVVAGALRARPEDRYPHAAAMIADLEAASDEIVYREVKARR